jgi:hypothetical protein
MQKLLSTLLMLMATTAIFAQVSITNATFPEAADQLISAQDTDATADIVFPLGGGQHTWDLYQVDADGTDTITFFDASEGASSADFSWAELVTIDNIGGQIYYDVSNNKMDAIGYAGPDPTGFGLNVVTLFDPPSRYRTAPLTFGDLGSYETNINFAFSTAFLPDSLLGGLGFDSLRLRVNSTSVEFVDGFGEIILPGGTFDIIRQKKIEYRETKMDAYLGFVGWFDITDIAGLDFLGVDTSLSFVFYSPDYKTPMATVPLNSDSTITSLEYILLPISGVDQVFTQEVRLSPNPAKAGSSIKITTGDMPLPAKMTLIAADGRIVASEIWTGNETHWAIPTDLSGIFQCQFTDLRGMPLATQNLLIGN